MLPWPNPPPPPFHRFLLHVFPQLPLLLFLEIRVLDDMEVVDLGAALISEEVLEMVVVLVGKVSMTTWEALVLETG